MEQDGRVGRVEISAFAKPNNLMRRIRKSEPIELIYMQSGQCSTNLYSRQRPKPSAPGASNQTQCPAPLPDGGGYGYPYPPPPRRIYYGHPPPHPLGQGYAYGHPPPHPLSGPFDYGYGGGYGYGYRPPPQSRFVFGQMSRY